jgi:hypothetical protein
MGKGKGKGKATATAQAATPAATDVQQAATPAATPAGDVQQQAATPAATHVITDAQRHSAYLTARGTLSVQHAAQVSFAWLTYARLHGAAAAQVLLPALVTAATKVPGSVWQGIAVNGKPANTAAVAALLALATVTE